MKDQPSSPPGYGGRYYYLLLPNLCACYHLVASALHRSPANCKGDENIFRTLKGEKIHSRIARQNLPNKTVIRCIRYDRYPMPSVVGERVLP
jgi:hypothetical protein